jgi:hypothetical protein
MKEIETDNTKFVYFPKTGDLPEATVLDMQVLGLPFLHSVWDEIVLNDFTDMRLILMKYSFQPDVWRIHFLNWDDGSNLEILDEKVAQDTFTDKDFKNAVITTFGRTKCFKCNWEGHTLVFFTSEAYIGVPELEQQKMKERKSRNGFKVCPSCGSKLRQMVIKIF